LVEKNHIIVAAGVISLNPSVLSPGGR